MKDLNWNKYILAVAAVVFLCSTGFSQNDAENTAKAQKKSNNLVYEANSLVENEDFDAAEMEYRKAISEQSNNAVGSYNLAHTYYTKGSFEEALYRSQEAAKNAKTKNEKHRAFHNIGNILMQNKKCREASEAFKSALRNNPNDEETRYNYALAKECAENQDQDGGGEDNKEDKNKDKEKDKEKKENDQNDKDDKKEEKGDENKKDGDDENDDKGKPEDEKKDEDKEKGDEEKNNQKPKQQPGKMSPQQIKNILEAMQNQEQKVQEKINAKKQKGAKVKTEKDW